MKLHEVAARMRSLAVEMRAYPRWHQELSDLATSLVTSTDARGAEIRSGGSPIPAGAIDVDGRIITAETLFRKVVA